jgi:hypothetical protein
MKLPRRLIGFGFAALAACAPTVDDGGDDPTPEATPPLPPPPPDQEEQEPNDENPQDLGVLALPWELSGTMSGCGEDGDWMGTDVDRFAFEVAEPSILRITLVPDHGDLDLRIFDPGGELLADLATEGVAEEALGLSIGAGASYVAEIRCWIGEGASWRLRWEEGG